MSTSDIITVFVGFVFAAGIGLLAIFAMSDKLVGGLENNTVWNATDGAINATTSIRENVMSKFDYLFFATFIALVIAYLIVSWLFTSEVIFLFINVIIIAIAGILAPIFANVWSTMVEKPQFSAYVTSFPITNHIISFLPYYVISIGLMGLFVGFIRSRQTSSVGL